MGLIRSTGLFLAALLLPGAAHAFYMQVLFGSEVLMSERLDLLRDKRVALVTNPVSMVGKRHLADTLLSSGIRVTAFFAAEHGIRGQAAAGELIKDGRDALTGLPVVSLYGRKKMPDSTDMAGIDAVVFDLQDVGARPFTYSSTLAYLMEACARHRKSLVVLDRPNPLGGRYAAGWMLEDSLRSFVGRFPLPMAHGLTLGELARMIQGEKWIPGLENLDLVVVPAKGWQRRMDWRATGRPWVAPSPNLADFDAVRLYPGTVLIEGTTLSEGRGTPAPFLLVGAPGLKTDAAALERLGKTWQVRLTVETHTPVSIPGRALQPKHENAASTMVRIVPLDGFADPAGFGVALLQELRRTNPDLRTLPFLRRLAGSGQIETALREPGFRAADAWKADVSAYIQRRKAYLLYE